MDKRYEVRFYPTAYGRDSHVYDNDAMILSGRFVSAKGAQNMADSMNQLWESYLSNPLSGCKIASTWVDNQNIMFHPSTRNRT